MLWLLQRLFGAIVVTDVVAEEFGEPLPEWMSIRPPQDFQRQRLLELVLDRGEASAIALALEQSDCLLIIDDLQGRKQAQQPGLAVTDTLGIIVQAKLGGYISATRPLLDSIRQTNFRLSDQLIRWVFEQAGEE